MCRPDQSLTACADPHCSLKYVSRPPCHTSFSPSPPTFLPIFKILPHFSPSHPLYPLSPKLHFAISPFFFSLSQRLHLSFYPREICPAGFSFFLLSTQLTNPREKEEQLVLHSKRKGWLDGWGGGYKKVDGKRDMGSERRRNMGEGDRGRLGDGERQ